MVNATLNKLYRENGTRLPVAEVYDGHEALKGRTVSHQQISKFDGKYVAVNGAWVPETSITPKYKQSLETKLEDAETEVLDSLLTLASLASDNPSKTDELGKKYCALKEVLAVARDTVANYNLDMDKKECAEKVSDAILNVKSKYSDFKIALGYKSAKGKGFESFFNHLKTGLTPRHKTERAFLEDYVAGDEELNKTADRFIKNKGYVTRAGRRENLGKYDKPRALLAALEKDIAKVLEANALILKRTLYAN